MISKPIKEVSESELQKHKKVSDILGFIKSGNLPMVHGLIKYHKLEQAVLLLKGYAEEFAMSKNEKVSMADWNPLLLAIAFKKLDIVHYLLNDLRISLKHAGKRSFDSDYGLTSDELVDRELFCLLLAVANRDLPMLTELWVANYTAWEEIHLHRLVRHMVNNKWKEGLQAVLKSYTSEILFGSLNH